MSRECCIFKKYKNTYYFAKSAEWQGSATNDRNPAKTECAIISLACDFDYHYRTNELLVLYNKTDLLITCIRTQLLDANVPKPGCAADAAATNTHTLANIQLLRISGPKSLPVRAVAKLHRRTNLTMLQPPPPPPQQHSDFDDAYAQHLDRCMDTAVRLLWRIVAVLVIALLVAPMLLQLCLMAAVLLALAALFLSALLVALPLRTLLLACSGGAGAVPLLMPLGLLVTTAVQAAPLQSAMVALFVPALLVLTPLLAPVVLVGLAMFERLDGAATDGETEADDE